MGTTSGGGTSSGILKQTCQQRLCLGLTSFLFLRRSPGDSYKAEVGFRRRSRIRGRWRRRRRGTRSTIRRRIKTRGGKDFRGFSVFRSYHGKMEDNLRKREIL